MDTSCGANDAFTLALPAPRKDRETRLTVGAVGLGLDPKGDREDGTSVFGWRKSRMFRSIGSLCPSRWSCLLGDPESRAPTIRDEGSDCGSETGWNDGRMSLNEWDRHRPVSGRTRSGRTCPDQPALTGTAGNAMTVTTQDSKGDTGRGTSEGPDPSAPALPPGHCSPFSSKPNSAKTTISVREVPDTKAERRKRLNLGGTIRVASLDKEFLDKLTQEDPPTNASRRRSAWKGMWDGVSLAFGSCFGRRRRGKKLQDVRSLSISRPLQTTNCRSSFKSEVEIGTDKAWEGTAELTALSSIRVAEGSEASGRAANTHG